MAKRGEERAYPASVGRVYSAVLRAIAELGYTTVHSDTAGRMVSFNTGRSMWTWAGQDLTATVVPIGADDCKLVIGGSIATRGSPLGGGTQLVGWGEKGRIVEKMFEAVRIALPNVPEPQTESEPPATVAAADPIDRVKKLHELREAGALTDEEFEREKAKALGVE